MRTGKLRLVLAVLVVAELLAALYLWLPRQRAPAPRVAAPEIEERHFLTVRVLDPSGGAVERTYETRSFVYVGALAIRMFSAWYPFSIDCYASYLTEEMWFVALGADGADASGACGMLLECNRYAYPSLVFLGSGTSADGGRTLGNPLRVSSVPTVTYLYNNVWFNVTVTATFSFSQDTTVSEAMLAVSHEASGALYVSLVYDSFPAVTVPAGGSLTIQWTFAWKDYGAFTENWGKLWQYALTLNWPAPNQYLDFTDDTGATVSIPWFNRYSGSTVALRLAWGSGTSPMSRSSYRLQSETGSAQAGFSLVGTGFSVGGAVGGQASEVGLYWLACDESGNPHRILLMRWVPGYALPAGTPVNIYVAKGG